MVIDKNTNTVQIKRNDLDDFVITQTQLLEYLLDCRDNKIGQVFLDLRYFFDISIEHMTYLLYFKHKAEELGLLISIINAKKSSKIPIVEEYKTLFGLL